MTKYHAKKTEIDGILFDSKLEADRYLQLKFLKMAGEISDLKLQPELQIFQGYIDPETGEHHKSRYYVGDFQYVDKAEHKVIVEDTKGIETADFRLKWDYVRSQYPEFEFRKLTRDQV